MAQVTTDLDCQISAISSLADRCSVTAVPTCYITATGADFGSDCCGSLYSWGTSVAECYLANAPDCLDTSAASDLLTDLGSYYSGVENPCAAYTTGLAAPTDTSGATATTGGGSSATAASTGASSTATGAAPKVGAGLKVYLAIALAGAMAGLSL